MTNDTGLSAGRKQISDKAFFSVVAVVALLAIAVGAYFINRGSQTTVTPVAAAPTNQAQNAGPQGAAAEAVVRKYLRLATSGKSRASCALESPAYLRFDATHYAHGSCAAESRAAEATLAAQGLSIQLVSTKVTSYTRGKATVLVTSTIGTQVLARHVYLQQRGGKWWVTGADDTGGDLGF